MTEPLRIGKSFPRGDAAAKASGRELYSVDHYPENFLWISAVRAGIAHAELVSVDVSEALAVPGVYRILTAKDIKGSNRQGIIHKDMPVLADKRILYTGDAVALVMAESRQSLEDAVDLVKIDVKILPAVFDPESAMKPDAPKLHENMERNLLMEAEIRKGEAETGFSACDAVVEGEFSTPVQDHAFLEPENGTAWMEPDGSITMIVSTQSPFRDRFEIGHAVGLPYDRIRIISPSLGGGFGGKDGATVQCFLALAALNAEGRPVRMEWSREEHMAAGYKRHSCKMKYRLGAKKDGTLHALKCSLVYDTGAYAHLGGEVMELGMEHAGGPYRIPHTLIEGKCVFTNNPVGGAMRAFGVCQASFGFESMMDMLAEKLGIDPLELRLKNAIQEGDTNCAGVRLITSTEIKGCLETISSHPLWKEREKWKEDAPLHTKRGLGLAAIFNAAGYGGKVRDSAIAKVELGENGEIIIHNAVSDMGQGNSSAFIQIAGHVLGQDASNLRLIQPDTMTAYPSGSSSAGRTTYTFGNALIKACEDMRSKLINRAGLLLFLDSDRNLVLEPGKIVHTPDKREVTFKQLAGFMKPEDRISINQFVAPACEEIPDTAKGFFIGFPHVVFAYGAHLARIEVDTLTGAIRVCDYLAVTDGGGIINPCMFDQQIQGGVAQGIGYAVSEDVVISGGKVRSDDFTTYIVPGIMDVPDIISIPVQGNEKTGPYGLKGVGEIAMNGPLPAIGNAFYDASGKRIYNAPLTPDRVLKCF